MCLGLMSETSDLTAKLLGEGLRNISGSRKLSRPEPFTAVIRTRGTVGETEGLPTVMNWAVFGKVNRAY